MNVGSLFSGIGGMDYGLARAGHDHVFFCDAAAAFTVSTLASSGKSGGWRVGADEAAGGQLVAAPLTKGSASGEGVNAPGRRQEDDVNLVPYTFDWQAGGSGDTSWRGKSRQWIDDKPGGPARSLVKNKTLAVHITQDPISGEQAPATGKGNSEGCATIGVSDGAGVRRLTPVECERLQGLPDDWTLLDARTPDSRRYSALGDAVTATVSEWIGVRMAELESEAA